MIPSGIPLEHVRSAHGILQIGVVGTTLRGYLGTMVPFEASLRSLPHYCSAHMIVLIAGCSKILCMHLMRTVPTTPEMASNCNCNHDRGPYPTTHHTPYPGDNWVLNMLAFSACVSPIWLSYLATSGLRTSDISGPFPNFLSVPQCSCFRALAHPPPHHSQADRNATSGPIYLGPRARKPYHFSPKVDCEAVLLVFASPSPGNYRLPFGAPGP
ncbi:hypothetical protein EV363DRAFT_314161 [Boletus edulis]|nr:hypothetical protein EV363DRAFT_314161 [Boletus edulis]